MRLVTFNVCSGRNPRSGDVSAPDLIKAVRDLDADVLALQEVDRDQPRSGCIDQARTAATAMGCAPGDWRFAAALHGTPGGDWSPASNPLDGPHGAAGTKSAEGAAFSGPSYGIALLSLRPVIAWSCLRLPPAPVRSPVMVGNAAGRPGVLLLRDEPRVALAAVIEMPQGLLTVVTTHLSFVPGWNVHQLRKLRQQLAGFPRPLVFAGDLNLPGRVPAWLTGWRSLAGEPTFPAPRPRVQLDHILCDGALAATEPVARELEISDHRALAVDLGI
jgi:endonuclease/exonuclease/phosphatase family metal-dependent hydrolase